MTAFWIAAALLAGVALAFVLPSLLARRRREGATSREANVALYRDQLKELDTDVAAGTLAPQHRDEARGEIERRVLEDADDGTAPARASSGRAAAIVLGLAVPLLALAVYLAVGNPGALAPEAAETSHGITRQQVEGMVAGLAHRLKENPEDAEGWAMLGRSYSVLDRYPEAAAAYQNAVKRSPGNAQLLADYANALAMAQGQRLAGEPERLIAEALKLEPDNVKALMLAGSAAFERRDFKGAIAHWERILRVVPPDADIVELVRDGIEDARKLSGLETKPAAGKDAGEAGAAAAPGGLTVTVRLAPGIAAKAAPGDTVFIFARAAQGPRMPLAVLRKQVSDLPATVTLDDSMAMTPAAKLSSQAQVVVGARVSKSGNPASQPGDLEGLTPPVKVGAGRIAVVIDREIGEAK
jgi:cytochrome c-type biogenesis protein CcmH